MDFETAIEKDEEDELKTAVIRLLLGFTLLLAGIFLPLEGWLSVTLFVIAYLVVGYDIVWRAFRNLSGRRYSMRTS